MQKNRLFKFSPVFDHDVTSTTHTHFSTRVMQYLIIESHDSIQSESKSLYKLKVMHALHVCLEVQ